MTDIIRLDVKGMTCDHCQVTVSKALSRAGLEGVEADWRRAVATGHPTDGFSTEKAAEELESVGYRLSAVEEPETGSSQDADAEATDDSRYELAIIGSGSAAFAAAIKASELGGRVAMIERDTIGGTCVNIGCVPSKALLRATDHFHRAGHSPFAGVQTTARGVDMAALVAQKDELVAEMRREKYQDLLDVYGFELIHGEARFTGPDRLEVDGRPLHTDRFLIAAGASPWAPPIEGLDETDYLTSTTALDLTDLPEELVVIGANAVGLELGQVFLHLGSRVTFIEALDRIAPFEEPEISEALATQLESLGADILTSATVTKAGRAAERRFIEAQVDGTSRRIEADQLLVATGRRARTEALGLEVAGVEVDGRGHVVVDDRMVTSNPKVLAAGDVTTVPQFVYVAALTGSIAAENALRPPSRRLDLTTMPRIIFTNPQIASVGLTEAEAREAGHSVVTSILPLDAVPRALVDHDTTGLVKLVADEADGRLLGAHILAEGAGDVIQAAVMAIKCQATTDDIADTFHPYLTMAEALKLAAQGFRKDVKHLSCCAA